MEQQLLELQDAHREVLLKKEELEKELRDREDAHKALHLTLQSLEKELQDRQKSKEEATEVSYIYE